MDAPEIVASWHPPHCGHEKCACAEERQVIEEEGGIYPRTRRCLWKDCGARFHPKCNLAVYCSEECTKRAVAWAAQQGLREAVKARGMLQTSREILRRKDQLRKAARRYRRTERGRELRRAQKTRARKRREIQLRRSSVHDVRESTNDKDDRGKVWGATWANRATGIPTRECGASSMTKSINNDWKSTSFPRELRSRQNGFGIEFPCYRPGCRRAFQVKLGFLHKLFCAKACRETIAVARRRFRRLAEAGCRVASRVAFFDFVTGRAFGSAFESG